jgi:hypothetical protein
VVITADMNEALAGLIASRRPFLVPNVQAGSVVRADYPGPGFDRRASRPASVSRWNAPRVTLQVDGQAVSFNEFVFGLTSVWDVDRIGISQPQTTTQGRNSIAGAIFVETPGSTVCVGESRSPVWRQLWRRGGLRVSCRSTGRGTACVRIAGTSGAAAPRSRLGFRPKSNRDDYGLVGSSCWPSRRRCLARLLTTYARRLADAPDRRCPSAVRGRQDPWGLRRVLYRCRFADRVLDYRLRLPWIRRRPFRWRCRIERLRHGPG